MSKIIFIIVVLISSVLALFEGDVCVLIDSLKGGNCIRLSNCNYAKRLLKIGIYPQNCGFVKKDALVCCPSKTVTFQNTTKSEEKCKQYNHIRNWSPSISNGKKAVPREFPHMVALGYQNQESSEIFWLCGGSLISDQFILTAAHCTYNLEYGNPKIVRLGDLNLNQTDDDADPKDVQISEVFVYPGYKPPSHYHDIALLKLNRSTRFNYYIKPACLHTEKLIPTNQAEAIGWGQTDFFSEKSSHLMKVTLNIIKHEKCAKDFSTISTRRLQNGINDDNQICAGDLSGKDTCPGDSGGPLQFRRDANNLVNHFVLIGVTSFGKACATEKTVGVYSRVSFYRSWIEDIVWPY